MATPAMRMNAVAAATNHFLRLRSELAGLLTVELDATAVVDATAALGENQRPSLPRRHPGPGASPAKASNGDGPTAFRIEIPHRSQKTASASTGCPLGQDERGPGGSLVSSLICGIYCDSHSYPATTVKFA